MMKRTVLIVSVLGIAAAGAITLITRHGEAKVSYRTAPVTRASLVQTVSATGSLSAVRTVSVGTQVSGQVARLMADFNDTVRAGQLIAQIDPVPSQEAVTQAQADLAKDAADVDEKTYLKVQADSLRAHGFMTDTDWHTADLNLQQARATVTSARAALQRAEQNLRYTQIKAPINGVIIERDVDVGQTVAASLQAPQLFVIAEDLKQMQILVSVDESDIGQIKEGQVAHFTVQTYGNRRFDGTVRQVRLQSKTTENVVNYTVVVAVNNADGALLPGMTATVEFETSRADSVLTVPNAALRFKPPASVIKETPGGSDTTPQRRTPSATTANRPAGQAGGAAGLGGAGGQRRAGGGPRPGVFAQLWYADSTGKPAVMRVRTGISDGQRTQVSGPPQLVAGLQVMTGVVTGSEAPPASQPAANPFQPAPSRGRGP